MVVAIPTLLSKFPYHQIQLLILLDLFYLIYYVGCRPHIARVRRLVEVVNELLIMAACYHIMCFSDFILQEEGHYLMGFGLIGIFLIVVVFNVSVVCRRTILQFRLRRMLKLKKKKLEIKL